MVSRSLLEYDTWYGSFLLAFFAFGFFLDRVCGNQKVLYHERIGQSRSIERTTVLYLRSVASIENQS